MTYSPSRRDSRRIARSTLLTFASLLSFTAISFTRPAHACSEDAPAPPLCQPAYVQLPSNASLTPNVPAIPFRAASPSAFAEASPLELRTAAGDLVASEMRDDPYGGRLLVPLSPLAAETQYRVHFVEHCTTGAQTAPDGEGAARDVAFSTTAAIALPTSIGEITVRTTTGATDVPTTSSCGGTENVRAVVAELVLHPSNEFHAVLPVASVYATEGTPDQSGVGALNYGTPDATEIVVGRLVAPCEPQTGLLVQSLGHHVVHVQARIAGSETSLPTVDVPVDLVCTGDMNPDAGADGGTTTTPPGGCSTRPGTMHHGASLFTALLAMLGVARMRRRAR